jgi:hypothetical protein
MLPFLRSRLGFQPGAQQVDHRIVPYVLRLLQGGLAMGIASGRISAVVQKQPYLVNVIELGRSHDRAAYWGTVFEQRPQFLDAHARADRILTRQVAKAVGQISSLSGFKELT